MTMAVRTVLQLGNPKLREVALPVSEPVSAEIRELIRDLEDTLQLPDAEPWPFINPVITSCSEEKIIVWDACLSFLSIFMQVKRHRQVHIRYQDVQGRFCELSADDDRNLSELLQHEIDHLDGILALDRITDIRTICTREEFELRYRAQSQYAVKELSDGK